MIIILRLPAIRFEVRWIAWGIAAILWPVNYPCRRPAGWKVTRPSRSN